MFRGGVHGVTFIVIENELGDLRSKPGRGCLHYKERKYS